MISTASPVAVKTVDEYLAKYVPELTLRLNSELVPLYDPAKEKWDPLLGTLARKPFTAQGDALMALDRVLQRQRYAILVGEMGTGKTLMGSALAYLHFKDRYRVLVMCPGHLVEKWAREIRETIPGATATIVWRVSDLVRFKTSRAAPEGREYIIIPRDRAKLGYRRKPAFFLRRRPYKRPAKGEETDTRLYVACPRCAEFAIDKETRRPLDAEDLDTKHPFCGKCGEALWQADRAGVRRFAPAEFIKRYLKGFIDLFIADEVHELKGGATAQGNALGMLASAARKTLCLTGTLIGGYAEHLFYLLYRMYPGAMRLGENLKYKEVQKWIARYGSLEYITKKTVDDGPSHVYSRGRDERHSVKHRPGISPVVFSRHLLSSAVFVELADVASCLPAYSEDVRVVPMSGELEKGYRDIEGKFESAMKDFTTRFKLMGACIATLLSYPDRPYGRDPIPNVGTPMTLPANAIYPKEQALLELVKTELAAKRRVFVFATFTGKLDVAERLSQLLRKNGIRTSVLRQDTVEVAEREEWIETEVKRGTQVIVANPELVKTGLDLLAFPTLAFFETGYNTFTLMQASRRSWRIGQRQPVKVVYFCYRKTLQETALKLMGAKVKATMALQGKFSSEGLTALCQGEDMMSALAKAIANGVEGLESAESYWRTQRPAGEHLQARESGTQRVHVQPKAAAPVVAARAKTPVPVSAPSELEPENGVSVTLDLFTRVRVPVRAARIDRPKAEPAESKPDQLQIAF